MKDSSSPKHHKVIILGSGPAGLTAAVYAARASLAPLVIHGPLQGGQLTTTTDVENYPGFPDGVMGPDLMQLMEKQAARFGAKYTTGWIHKVKLGHRPFVLEAQSESFSCDALIIATGATPKLIGLPKEKELMGYGVSTCATCDGAFFRNQVIAVVGGGDSACEEANFLTRFGSKVVLIHRRSEMRASKIMRDRLLANPKVEIKWNRTVEDIIGTREAGVSALVLKDTQNPEKREEIQCNALFVAIGHTPNSEIFRGMLDMDENGYLTPRPNSTATNIPGVFACGDVQDHVFRQAITAAGTGCMAAIEAERWLEAKGE